MSRFRSSLIAAGVLGAFAACSEAAAPKGTPGDLTVRVYVDKDANGAWSVGDSAITGVTVQAFKAGAPSQAPVDAAGSATTTSDSGKAVIRGLEPGVYTVALGAGAPAGSAVVLLTNPAPQVAISQQGRSSATPEFRFAPNAGRISGRIYSDVNANGSFDAGTDVAGAGLAVAIRRNVGGAAADTLQLLAADSLGAYASGPLALGTYFVQFENPGSITYATPELAQVTLTGGQTLAVSNTFTGSLILTIRNARARAEPAQVAVLGNVTVAPGQITANTTVNGVRASEIWVQDTSGGISVFPVPTSDSSLYPLGQRVLVTGVRSNNSGAAQIGTTASVPTLATRTGGSVVAPLSQTGTQVNALTNEGRLVTLSGFTVTSVGTASATSGAYTVTGTTPDGQSVQVRVTGPATVNGTTYLNNNIARTDWVVGSRYTVTGVLSRFTSGTTVTAQIKTRQRSDVAGPVAISQVRAVGTAGQQVTVQGVLTVNPGLITSSNGANSELWVQDATGGLAIFPVPSSTAGLAIGDRVEVTGITSLNAGQLQIGSTTNVPTVTRLGAGTAVTPVVQTGTQVNARTLEGQLVTLQSFTVTTVGTASTTTGAYTVTGTAADGQSIQVRVTGPVTINGTTIQNSGIARTRFTVGSTYSVTGVLSQFNGTAQLKPRISSDVTP